MTTAIEDSSNGELSRKFLLKGHQTTRFAQTNLRIDESEIVKCVEWIEENKYVKVGLQFPDEWLNEADKIAVEIQNKLTLATVYILADSSYGSCCVDEISAAHVLADSIIHFGPACLSPFDRLPIYYVFEKCELDHNQVLNQLTKYIPDKLTHLLLLFDVKYSSASGPLYKILSDHFTNLIMGYLVIPGADESQANGGLILNGRRIRFLPETSESDYSVIYIGEEGRVYTSFLMALNKCKFYRYDSIKNEVVQECNEMNKSLRKRVYFIEKAKSANIVGILIGTLGVSGYGSIIERLKQLGKNAGKKMYTIVVGKLNPNKLANFPEIDVFVLIACWENSLLDSRDFYKPIITPFEFELACNENREWTGDFTTDFRQLLPDGMLYLGLPESEDDRHENNNKSLVACENTVSEMHQAGEFLRHRSWRGLEPKVGETEVTDLSPGQFGIASKYENEK